MLSNDEVDVINECLFHGSGADAKQYQHFEDEIVTYLSNQGLDSSYLPEIQRLFEVREERLCSDHKESISACGCASSKETTFVEYLLSPEPLVTEWAESVRERGVFKEFDEKDDLTISAKYGDTTVSFNCFFDRDRLERYSFEPLSLEFGVDFTSPNRDQDEDWIFSWNDFLSDEFQDRFEGILQSFRSVISADFYEYEPISDFRGTVEETLRNYLKAQGYSIRREVGDVCPEATRYGIDTGQSNFAAIQGDSTIIICHCDKSDGWHVHNFRNGSIESAESIREIDHMIDQISSRINKYRNLQQEKRTVSNFANTLTAVVAVITAILVFDNLNPIAELLDLQQVSAQTANAFATLLLLINTFVVVGLGIAIVRPYFNDIFRFTWEIQPLDSENKGIFGRFF